MLNIERISPEVLEQIAANVDANDPLGVFEESMRAHDDRFPGTSAKIEHLLAGVELPLDEGSSSIRLIRRAQKKAIEVLIIPTQSKLTFDDIVLSDEKVEHLRFGTLSLGSNKSMNVFNLAPSFPGRDTERKIIRFDGFGWTDKSFSTPPLYERDVTLVTGWSYGYQDGLEYRPNLDANGRRYPSGSMQSYETSHPVRTRDTEPTPEKHNFKIPKLRDSKIFENFLLWKLRDGTLEST